MERAVQCAAHARSAAIDAQRGEACIQTHMFFRQIVLREVAVINQANVAARESDGTAILLYIIAAATHTEHLQSEHNFSRMSHSACGCDSRQRGHQLALALFLRKTERWIAVFSLRRAKAPPRICAQHKQSTQCRSTRWTCHLRSQCTACKPPPQKSTHTATMHEQQQSTDRKVFGERRTLGIERIA